VSVFADFGLPDAVTTQGQDNMVWLWRIFLIGAIAVSALIWILVIVSVVRFRRRSDEIPSQKQYNIPLEVAYTIAPLVVVAVLFGLTVYAQNGFTELSDDPSVRVEVEGFQWQWQFRYPDDGVTITGSEQEAAVLVVPVGETIRFQLVSDDVNHSFWVPEFLEKRDLIPGIDNQIDVEITEPGQWTGRCAEYCGLDHWLMTFQVVAVPVEQYRSWINQARLEPQPIIVGTSDIQLPTVPSSDGAAASEGSGS
jgi:cytochrome c oxidase subunit 2